MKRYALLAAAVLALNLTAHADPVVVGDPSKGTPITTVVDGNKKVQITTSGISVEGGDEEAAAGANKEGSIQFKSTIESLEDILVPIAFFGFLLAVILGGKYLSSRNEEKRLNLLRLMVEKGQPVPENVVTQILSPQGAVEADGDRQAYKRTRNAYGFSIAGALLIGYALLTGEYHNTSVMVPGLIFLCLGMGGMAGLYLSKRDEKVSG